MGNKLNDIDRMYRDITASCMDCEDCEMDESIVLRQIAWNIAHLADEVRAFRKTIEGALEDISIEFQEEEPEEEQKEEPEENDADIVYCFHCGKKMKVWEAASTVIAMGRKRYICKACDKDIDSFINDFLFH